jgi:hypothetical protein
MADVTRFLPPRRGLAFPACWMIAATLLAVAIWFFGHRQMGGFDHSALVDTAWRLASHQKPYRDFYLTTPVGFYLGAGLAFAVWGANWSALVWVTIVYALVTFALLSVCLASYTSPRFGIGLALTCELLAMGVTSYWWYNSITAITACVFVAAAIAFARRPSSRPAIALFALAMFLLLMMKPNTAGMLGVLVVAILFTLRPATRKLLIVIAVSTSAFLALLAALGINPLSVARSYLGIAGARGLPSVLYFTRDKPGEAYLIIPLIILCILPLVASAEPAIRLLQDRVEPHAQILLLSLAGMVMGVFGMFTNSDSNLVVGVPLILLSALGLPLWLSREGLAGDESPPWLAVAAAGAALGGATMLALGPSLHDWQRLWVVCLFVVFACLLLGVASFRRSSVLLACILVLVGGSALLAGSERVRVKYMGEDVFYSDEPLVEIPGVPFFDDFLVSPRLREVVGEMSTALHLLSAQPGQPPASVYFGPRLEFAYAAFGLPSPRHLPVWYHAGTSYPEAMSEAIVRTYLASTFDIVIFLRTGDSPDLAYLPAQITEHITSHYQRVDYPEIVVFLRETR